MKYEYILKIFSMEDLKKEGVVVDQRNNIVYACRPDGECEMHDVGAEQLDNMSRLLNKMGDEGWELVQFSFHQSGVVSFWKRSLRKGAKNKQK